MKLAVISFTEHGSRLNAAVSAALALQGYDCESTAMPQYAEQYGLTALEEPLKEWTRTRFQKADGLLFIGAAGIAVRSIAPFLQDKTKDPAVVVMDERGVFAISLLSGHLGGANELAGVLANLTGAIPVVTTATDINGRFAVDIFAKKNGLVITDMKRAKEISADVLDEKTIGFCTEFPVIGETPRELQLWDEKTVFEGANGICVTLDEGRTPYRQTLCLIPRIVSIGVGCRRGAAAETIAQKVREVLAAGHISPKSVEKIASIDLKQDEPGIRALAAQYGAELEFYTAEELAAAPGEYTSSEFVRSVAGVDNVCERSAVLASGGGRLIEKKTAADGVTVAVAVRKWSVEFG